MFKSLHIIEYPSGRWGFVGRVPASLLGSYETREAAAAAAEAGGYVVEPAPDPTENKYHLDDSMY